MKKILYILSAVLLVAACAKLPEDPGLNTALTEPDSVYPDGATVDLFFSVPAPVVTKGEMADEPDIDNLYVAVFDGAGTLKEYVEATPVDFDDENHPIYVNKNGKDHARRFKARVLLKNAERHLHFIANGPTKAQVDAAGGTESSLSQQWVTNYANAAFWQRIVLPNGITAYTFSDKKSDGTAWAAGNQIDYYYLIDEEDGKEVYVPASSSTANVLHAFYEIKISNGHPYYYDDKGQIVNPGDFVNAKGEKIIDGTGYFQSDEVTGAVNLVPLVRNFARIRLYPEKPEEGKPSEANFIPKAFYLMNIPNQGTIVPYSATVGGFVPEFTTSSSYVNGKLVVSDPIITGDNDDLMDALNDSRYAAAMPTGASLIQTVDDVKANGNEIPTSWTLHSVDDEQSAFLFERGLPTKDQAPTYLLVKGTLNGVADRWIKVELSNAEGKYFRVFRGVTYALEISKIVGSDGFDSAAEAALGPVVSDVSNSLATENLEQISDGTASLWVEYIDYVGTDPDGETKTILYKIYDSDGPLTPTWDDDGDSSTPVVPRYELSVSPAASAQTTGAITAITGDAAYTGADSSTPDKKGGWRIATVTLRKTSTTEDYESILTVSASTNAGKKLSRKVRYHVMGTRRLNLTVTQLLSESPGERTYLTVKLPKGLPYSMFPLTFEIEAERGNLNPVPSENKYPRDHSAIDLPVETGTSYFTGKSSFHFLFTVNYSDYYDRNKVEDPPYYTEFVLCFSTTKDYASPNATGSNTTWVSVTDRNHRYFFYKPETQADFYTDANFAATKVTVSPYRIAFDTAPNPIGASATSYEFDVTSNTEWKAEVIEGDDVSLSVSPSTGDEPIVNGNGTVRLTFNPNEAETAREIKVKVSMTSNPSVFKIMTLKQMGVVTSSSVRISELSFDNNHDASQTVDDYLSVAFAQSQMSGDNVQIGRRGGSNHNGSVTFTPSNGAVINKVVIEFTNADNAEYAVGINYSAPSGWSYTRNGATITWTGSASSAFTLTLGRGSGNYDWPVAKSITVSYQ